MTIGVGSENGFAPSTLQALQAALRSAAQTADGDRHSAAKYEMLRFVSTVRAQGNVIAASSSVTRSPLTRVTGTPHAPAKAALIVSSPIGAPLSLHSKITRGLYVCPITASAEPIAP